MVAKKTKKVIKGKNNKEEESLREIKVRVIGLGGGGGSIIASISPNLKKVLFAALNTDVRALEEVTKRKKIKSIAFGKELTGGLGTGMDKELGRKAAEEDIEEVKPLFKEQDVVIFVSALGGGTGTGALPVFASMAKEMGCIVYGVFTLPFPFEGEKKMRMSREAIKETNPYLHAVTILPNEKIFEVVDKNTPLKKALTVMNEDLARSLEGLVETIYETGLINIDFADVRTILQNRKGTKKLTYLNTAEGKLEEGTQEIVRRALSNPLYPYPVNKAKGILFNITGGKDIGLTEISSISETISQYTEDDAKIIVGIMQRNNYKDKVKVALLATGCGTDYFQKELGDEEEEAKKSEKSKSKNEKRKKKEKEKKVKKAEGSKKENNKEKEEKIEVVPGKEERIYFDDEEKKMPENEEEKEIFEEEEKWEKPSFLKRLRKNDS